VGIDEPIADATVAILDREIDFEETASVLDGGAGVTLSSPEAADTYRTQIADRIESTAENLAARGVDVPSASRNSTNRSSGRSRRRNRRRRQGDLPQGRRLSPRGGHWRHSRSNLE